MQGSKGFGKFATMKKLTLMASAIIMAWSSCMSTAAANNIERTEARTYKNPVTRSSLPDPTLIRANDGYFYLYATEDTRNMPIWRSRNLVDWAFVGTAFTDATRPKCIRPGINSMWAPDINYINGQYVLYYSIGRAAWDIYPELGFGVATSERPEGPFVDRGVVFMGAEYGQGHSSIDQFYIEEDGKKYLIWGCYTGIYIVQLTNDGLRKMPGATATKIVSDKMMVEGSYVYKRNGYYYLVCSHGACCDNVEVNKYKIVYGRAKSLFGPYQTKDGRRMLDGPDNYEELIVGNDYCAGPGHNAEWVDDDNGDTWIVYHGYLKPQPALGRVLWLDQVKWRDDWPYVDGGSPSRSSKAPYFKDAR